MAEFFPLLDRSVASLGDQSAEARSMVYERARAALLHHLQTPEAPASEERIARETEALDAAIARLEARYDPAVPADDGDRGQDFGSSHAPAGLSAVEDGPREGAAEVVLAPASRRQFAFNAAASGSVSIFKTLLQLALLPLMARLLGPTAYGIYSLAFPTVMFFVLLADGGMGMSLAREDESNRKVWSTAFWTLLGTCLVMAVGVVCSGFVLARISGQPSLVGLMAFLALALPILAFMLPADARLVRRGNLLYHSGSDLVASIVGAGVAVTLAYNGAGAWSLAAQYITSFTIRAVILNTAAWSPPDFVYDFACLRGHISTGGAMIVSRLGELGSKLAENTAFGHIFGTSPLGSYTLGNQVSRFACDAVTNPVVGAFYAQALRETDAQVAALHQQLTRVVLLVLFPATAMMAVAAPVVFPLILGPKWVDAAPLFQAVVVPYSLAAAGWLAGQILLKHGMAHRSAKVLLGCGAVRVGAVSLGTWASPLTVAWLVGGTYVLQAVAMTLAVPRGLGADLRTLCVALWRPALAAAAAAAGVGAILARFPANIVTAVAAAAFGSAVYLILLFVLDGPTMRADVRTLSRALGRRTA